MPASTCSAPSNAACDVYREKPEKWSGRLEAATRPTGEGELEPMNDGALDGQ
jgi:hypothetical protein